MIDLKGVQLIIPALVGIAVMMSFLTFIFKNIAKRVNDSIKKVFVDKLQNYDYIINEKEQNLKGLLQEIEKLKKECKELNEERNLIVNTVGNESRRDFVYNIPTPDFREEHFFRNYKNLKDVFDLDTNKIVKEFIERRDAKETKEQKVLAKIKSYFNPEAIYGCLTLSKEDQIQVIEEIVEKEANNIIDIKSIVQSIKEFNIIKFLDYLENKIEEISPMIHIFTGKSEIDYTSFSENISTQVYKNMSEGVMIHYQNQIYDYSI